MFENFKKMFTRLLQEGKDSLSSTRFSFLFSVLVSNISIFGCWLILSCISNTILPIPESVVVLYGLANGLSFSGKVFQRWIEGKNEKEIVEKK